FAFDDDVFVTKAERIIPEQAPYTAKEENDGWFHSFDDYDSLMLERHGPNQLKSAIEHDYFRKRYAQALKEMGNLLVQARVYPLCGRPGDALSAVVRYHKLRRLDYHAWHLSATIMYTPPLPQVNSHAVSAMRNHIAHAAIQRSIRIMTASQWALSIDHVRRRYERELEQLQTLAKQITENQGNADTFFTWMQSVSPPASHPEQLASVGLDMFDADDIDFIYRTCVMYQE
ncbi:hypothetical protein BDB00DRAFT_744107, partial [Zychaea mexicana]|uniref:uncharacterized protein n=1 Tax=Zychaea mexicana TaxID=64656 RepID=UPI0022FE1ADA